MAKSISRRHAFAGLGLSMASVLPLPRPLRAAAEPIESGTPDDRMVLHLEPLLKAENAEVEVFCPGSTGLQTARLFAGMLEKIGELRRSPTDVNVGSIPIFLSGLWPTSDYYSPIPHRNCVYIPEGEAFRHIRDSDFHLRSEVMLGSAIARIADPWVVVHHDDVQARFDRVVSSYSGSPRNRVCLIGSTLEFPDQIRSAAWTAQLCRNRTDTLISVVPCLAPATREPSDPDEKRYSPHEAVRRLMERSDLKIQVHRSYFPAPNEDQWEDPDLLITEAIKFVTDFLRDPDPEFGRQAFIKLFDGGRTGYFHQMFVSPALCNKDVDVAIRERISYSRKDREVTACRVRYCFGGAVESVFRQPSLVSGTQPVAEEENKLTAVQWLNLVKDKGATIASG